MLTMEAPTTPTPVSSQLRTAILRRWRRTGTLHWMRITGTSMRPLLKGGDQILIVPGVTPFRRGDLLVFEQAGQLVAHRLLYTTGETSTLCYVTKGDNRTRLDPPVPTADIVGRVAAIRRGGRIWCMDRPVWRWINGILGWSLLGDTVVRRLLHRGRRRLKGLLLPAYRPVRPR